MPGDALPSIAPIVGDKKPAAGTSTLASPSLDVDLPGTREKSIRILWIYSDFRGACIFVDEEDALPCLAAILVRKTPRSG